VRTVRTVVPPYLRKRTMRLDSWLVAALVPQLQAQLAIPTRRRYGRDTKVLNWLGKALNSRGELVSGEW
jgi:hypothetical protein